MDTTEKYRMLVLYEDNGKLLEFRTKKIDVEKIVQLSLTKRFIKGILEEKVDGKWMTKWILKRWKDKYYLLKLK